LDTTLRVLPRELAMIKCEVDTEVFTFLFLADEAVNVTFTTFTTKLQLSTSQHTKEVTIMRQVYKWPIP